MIYHYRCSDRRGCGARRTLKHLIDWFIRRPKCPCCKKDTLSLDPSVKRQRKKSGVCGCAGYHFPHRKGGGVWCIHHPVGPQEGDAHPIFEAVV